MKKFYLYTNYSISYNTHYLQYKTVWPQTNDKEILITNLYSGEKLITSKNLVLSVNKICKKDNGQYITLFPASKSDLQE